MNIYDEKTKPLVDFYEKKGIITTQEVSEKTNRLGQDVAEDVYEQYLKKNI